MNDEFIPTLTHATERDIDLLLVEELHASLEFVEWVARHVDLEAPIASWDVKHSKRRTRSRREIDIFVEIKDREGRLSALLIENKLDATEQPDQAESYREELTVLAPSYARSAMIIVCPKAYRAEYPEFVGKFDAVIEYEEIAAFFRELQREVGSDLILRCEFRAAILDQAVHKHRRGYWDIERKRYPQYDHCAVLIAEDITSRFLNVISLFNGTIPFIAIQMQALRVGGQLTLVFTRVVDELSRGLVDEDEDAESAPADRTYWEQRGTKATLSLADKLMEELRKLDPSLSMKYNKYYIGLSKDGLAYNFVAFRPKKSFLNLDIKIPETDDVTQRIEAAGIDLLTYNSRWGYYRLRLSATDIQAHLPLLRELMGLAFERRSA